MNDSIVTYLKSFPDIVVKKTKTGQRFLLKSLNNKGNPIYQTIHFTDKDTKKDCLEKIESARIKLNSKKINIDFPALVHEYVSENQLSSNTKNNLLSDIKRLCNDESANRQAILNLVQSGLKQTTKHVIIGRINGFFKWLNNSKHIDIQNPCENISIKAQYTPRKRILDDAEIETLFKKLPSINIEFQVVIRLAFFTGARISSIHALQPNDIRDGKVYYYNAKTKKPYQYPIPINDAETVELAHSVLPFKKTINNMSSCINRYLQFWFSEDENGERISIHSLRHTYASRLLQAGVQPDIIARLLDHSSPSITLMVYARHSDDQLQSAVDRVFPICQDKN